MNAFLWHGLLMAVAWLLLFPAGALVARFFKVRRNQGYPYHLDDQAWWNAHRLLQSAGAVLAVIACWIVWDALDNQVDWPVLHVQLGAAALLLLVLQLMSTAVRGTKGGPTDVHADPYDPDTWRGDHFDMTFRRRAFEFVHKKLGYVGMLLAVGAAWTGIELAGLDAWWKVGIAVAVLAFATLFVHLTLAKRRVDTWKAIWGPYEE